MNPKPFNPAREFRDATTGEIHPRRRNYPPFEGALHHQPEQDHESDQTQPAADEAATLRKRSPDDSPLGESSPKGET